MSMITKSRVVVGALLLLAVAGVELSLTSALLAQRRDSKPPGL